MITGNETTLDRLVRGAIGSLRASRILGAVRIPDALLRPASPRASRTEIAFALNVLLLEDVLKRVPMAAAYVRDLVRADGKIDFDHGALRTIAAGTGELPAGRVAFARILEPLGYDVAKVYPLDRIGMTGYAFAQRDLPADIPQFFVSELHPERFSEAFQDAAGRVFGESRDPLGPESIAALETIRCCGSLPIDEAVSLLPELAACFGRQHAEPSMTDYETLLAESREAAWISTEGNAFNHATDRVEDVLAVSNRQKSLGRPMKDRVEVSGSGRVIQTAFRAARVERLFVAPTGELVSRTVPGSFFEFITRREVSAGALDLGFDASNAQAIFQMTAAA